jgi:hypothetical protein
MIYPSAIFRDPHAEADHPCRDQPLGTRGIDQFIGEPQLIGRGHGTAFIHLFVESLFEAGARRVVTDPNPRDSRAIRAYTKAGFKEIDRRITISGEALLMGRNALPFEPLVLLQRRHKESGISQGVQLPGKIALTDHFTILLAHSGEVIAQGWNLAALHESEVGPRCACRMEATGGLLPVGRGRGTRSSPRARFMPSSRLEIGLCGHWERVRALDEGVVHFAVRATPLVKARLYPPRALGYMERLDENRRIVD